MLSGAIEANDNLLGEICLRIVNNHDSDISSSRSLPLACLGNSHPIFNFFPSIETPTGKDSIAKDILTLFSVQVDTCPIGRTFEF